MEQIIVNGSYEKVLDEIYKVIEEEGSNISYNDQVKGIIIIKRTIWSWDRMVMRIITVTPLSDGCQVRVSSFLPPVSETPRRMKAAELRIIDGLKGRMASTEILS